MKQTLTLTMIMLVLFSFGGLAQKPQKELDVIFQKSQRKHSDSKRKLAFDEEKAIYRQQAGDEQQVKHLQFGNTSKLKAAQALPTEQLDSIVDYYWVESQMKYNLGYRNWFEYDSLGRNTMDTWLGADSDTTFPDYGGMYEIVWDANGNYVEDFQWNWTDSTGFVEDSWGTYEYDGNGNNTVETTKRWVDSTKSWIPDYTDTITFDGMNNRIERISYYYEPLMMDWGTPYRETWQYDTTGNLISNYQYYWNLDSSHWDMDYRTDYLYDQNDFDTARIYYYWDGQAWMESSMDVTGRNARGARIFEGYFYWTDSIWKGSSKYEYTLDVYDLVIEEIDSYWDEFKSEWYIERKYTYERDALGNILVETSYNYDTAQMSYTGDWRDTYTWDDAVSWDDLALPLEVSEDQGDDNIYVFFSKPVKFISENYDTTTMSWDTSGIEDIFYSPFTGGTVKPVDCEADFHAEAGQSELDIEFTDASGADVSSWYWTFGDGSTSTMQNPMHTYKFGGTYRVSLSTTDLTGECSNTIIKQIKVGTTLCNAEFTMAVDTAGKMITTTNMSLGTNLKYFWNFGDGSVSKEMSPSHTYQFAGSYDITLTIQNDTGTCMDRYSLSTLVGTGVCRAGFDVFVDSATSTARFSARAEDTTNIYRWEFGDGTIGKTRNIEKTFTHPGYYTARLTVSNNTFGCVNSQKVTVLIGRPSPGGKAGFIYVSGDSNTVKFNDRSLGDNLNYYWDFNDGDTSTSQSPSHKYVLPGYYNVCLTVSTADGKQNTYCEKIFAGTETTDHCLAQFEYRLSQDQLAIACLDRSLGSPDTWKWTYDDDWSTADQNPTWSTSTPKYVKIQQTILNSGNGCRDDAFALINMGAEGKLKAAIGYIIDSTNKKADTYPVDFVGVSLGDAGKLKWDFGDGTSDSTSVNPTHVYTEPGTYNVCLTITNTTTGAQDKSCETVTVGGGGSTSSGLEFSVLDSGLKSYPNPFNESTTIEIFLADNSEIDLTVYDLMGRKVQTIARDQRLAGLHTFQLDGANLEAGNYYLILKTGRGVSRTVLSVIK